MKTSQIAENAILETDRCFYLSLDENANYVSVDACWSKFICPSLLESTDLPFLKTLAPASEIQFNKVLAESVATPGQPVVAVLDHRNNESQPFTVRWEITAFKFQSLLFIARGEVLPLADTVSNSNNVPLWLLNGMFDNVPDIICAIDTEGRFIAVSSACKALWGYEPEEMINRECIEFIHKNDVVRTREALLKTREDTELKNFENRYLRKDGVSIPIFWSAKWNARDKILYCVARDGVKRKEHENTLKASEEKYRLLFFKNPEPMWIYDTKTLRFLEVNEAARRFYGYTREEFLKMSIKDIRPPEEVPKLLQYTYNQSPKSPRKTTWIHCKKNKEIVHVEVTAHPLTIEGREAKLVLVSDITARVKAEDKLLKSNERYYYASKAAFDAIWDWDLATEEVNWSDGYETLFGYHLDESKETNSSWTDHIHPEDRWKILNSLTEAIESGETNWSGEYRFIKADGSFAYVINRGIIIRDSNNKAYRMIGAMQDYTDKENNELALKKLNTSLERRAAQLASSNQELERFAYVASHDLQEPLRMVSSFLQLLQRRYKEKLDDKANEYIHFAVDGAERMKTLILDLLKYSRVNSVKEQFEKVELNDIFPNILLTFGQVIRETNAMVQIDPLPAVVGAKMQLVQLFQNLIGNALKYKGEQPPSVHVGVTDEFNYWQFYVKDNGMGIDPRFFDKVFIIFQRLHHRDEYSGTGIGLAICKKIVERHGGRIWVESELKKGSTFHFTIKKDLKITPAETLS